MKHKKLLAAVLAVCMVAAIICLECCAFSPESTLILYSQRDCIHPDVLEDFTEETGIQVEYALLDENASVSQQAACDVLLADTELLSLLNGQGCLTELDLDQISNCSEIAPLFFSMPYIRDSQTALPTLWTTMGLIYDPTMTDIRITGWSDLFSQESAGRIVMPISSREAYAAALSALGMDVNTSRSEDIAAARGYLEQQMPLVLNYASLSELSGQISSCPWLVAPCYGADAIQLMASEQATISFVIPSEGSWQKVLSYSIPTGSQNTETAHELIDYLCRPDVMARNAAYSGYSVVSSAAYELLDHNWKINPLAYPSGTDWNVYPLLDRQTSQVQTECQVHWHQLRENWNEHHRDS